VLYLVVLLRFRRGFVIAFRFSIVTGIVVEGPAMFWLTIPYVDFDTAAAAEQDLYAAA
jgi:hypothetical protein